MFLHSIQKDVFKGNPHVVNCEERYCHETFNFVCTSVCSSSIFVDLHKYILCFVCLVLLILMLVSTKTMSWSLIPGRGLHLFTSDLWVVKTRSRVLSSRVGKSTICSIHKSCTLSMKDLFMWFGYVEPSIVTVFQLISGKLMSPAIHKLLCLVSVFKWTKSLRIFSVYVISCKDGGL